MSLMMMWRRSHLKCLLSGCGLLCDRKELGNIVAQMASAFVPLFLACLLMLLPIDSGQAARAQAQAAPRKLELPRSSLLNDESRVEAKRWDGILQDVGTECTRADQAIETAIHDIRKCLTDRLILPVVDRLTQLYSVDIDSGTIAGVPVEIFTPSGTSFDPNDRRVLINLHGGGFLYGETYGGRIESIPIAALAHMRVVSVDYRLAPEHRFPAATDDVVAVYRALLKDHDPRDIGIYGCSAGALLVAQTLARLQSLALPSPRAAGMFCGGAGLWSAGFSGRIDAAISGKPPYRAADNPYLAHADPNDPLVFPLRSEEILKRFPPTLLITTTRDRALSVTVSTHAKLKRLGVPAELRIWEDLDHSFLSDPDQPETRAAYKVIADYFVENIGRFWFAPEIQKFITDDINNPPRKCSILFLGSSSIRFWDQLEQDMAPVPVIKRGFGGAQISDVIAVFDQVVLPYWPKGIFFYAGENDIAKGVPPTEVAARFGNFLALKDAALGEIPVYFLSAKPSRLRIAELAEQRELNEIVKAMARSRPDLHFVDVASPMFANGQLRDVFREDGVHLSAEGYALWKSVVRPHVEDLANTPAHCRSFGGARQVLQP